MLRWIGENVIQDRIRNVFIRNKLEIVLSENKGESFEMFHMKWRLMNELVRTGRIAAEGVVRIWSRLN